MDDKIDTLIVSLKEAAKDYRTARIDTFEAHELQTFIYREVGPVVGIGKRNDNTGTAQRTTVLQAVYTEKLEMLEVSLKGAVSTPAETAIKHRVLVDLLQFLHGRRLLRFSDVAFRTLTARITDSVRDEHWRTSALPVPIHNGDLIVLKSPTPNPQTGKRVQVLMAYRESPTAPLGAADISTGRVIPNFVLQQGRVAKLTSASAQHISPQLMKAADVQHLLKHQFQRDLQKSGRLKGQGQNA